MLFVVFLFSFQTTAAQISLDPCRVYTNLTERSRDVNNQPRQSDLLLCDRYIQHGWYRFDGLMPTSCQQPFRCGTQAPIWLDGSVPNQGEGIVRRTACANTHPNGAINSSNNCCQTRIPIEVKNCGNFVVYCLRRPPGCPMAYCTEAPPRLLSPPALTGPEIFGNRFRFGCSIFFPQGVPNIAFNVTWNFDGVNIARLPATILTGDNRVAFLDQDYWQGNIGKTLRCRVETFYTTTPTVRGQPEDSNGYWGGIKITPTTLVVSEAEGPRQVNITSTLPILCDHNLQCNIQLDLDVQGGSWEDIATSRCRLLLTRQDWNPVTRTATVSTTVQATRDFVRDGDQRLQIIFNAIYTHSPSIWQEYSVSSLSVYTVDRDTRRCSGFADPHIRGLERRASIHLYDAGDYVMVRSTERPFEVHIRTWSCVGRGCICAVAVQEGDDILAVNICNNTGGPQPARVHVLSEMRLDPGTKIQRSPDGRNFMFTFGSGSWLRVQDLISYLNIEIQVPAIDFGTTRGLCGTFDNNPNNEFTGPDGRVFPDTTDFPIEFFRSWRLAASQSLINGNRRPGSNSARIRVSFPSTQCMCNAQSNTIDCGQTRNIQDPGRKLCNTCVDVTDKVLIRQVNTSDDNVDENIHVNIIDFRAQISVNFTVNVGVNFQTGSGISRSVPTTVRTPFDPPRLFPTQSATIPPTRRPFEPQITEERAHAICLNAMMNFTIGGRCSSAAGFDMSSFLTSCVQDMVAAQTTFFLQGAVSAMQAGCQEAILRNISNYNISSQGRRLPMTDVTREMCPNQCSLRGICQRGRCLCDPGFTSLDCSVDTTRPPAIINILRNGLCDRGRRTCRISYLVVENFFETPTIACRLRDVVMNGGQLQPSHNSTTVPADFESSREVGCHLPDARVPKDRAVHGYLLSLTTDGSRFSNEVLYLIYDSSCLVCNKHGSCGIKNYTCLINGRCRRDREENPINPSDICDPGQNQKDWTSLLSALAANEPSCVARSSKFDRWDVWTSNRTGCPCFFNNDRWDCACCEVGGCQCPAPNTNQCVLCGRQNQQCGTRQPSPQFGVDGYTKSLTGCQCKFDLSRTDCACCQNDGCQCGQENRNQCAPCGRPKVCGSKPDVFGTLRIV